MDGDALPPVPPKSTDDLVQPFQVENGAARGRLVRLGPVVHKIIAGHQYPEPVAALLTQAIALSVLVAGIFKFDGVFSLQAKGDGPVSLLVVDLTSDGALRGFAQYDKEALAVLDEGWRDGPVPYLLGGGYLAFTVNQGQDTESYQGIVDLTGTMLADCAHNYFRQSDQLEAVVKLTSGLDNGGSWRAAGLLVQKMPPKGLVLQSGDAGDDDFEEAWRRAVVLMSSSRDGELLDRTLHPHDLLFRLFHEDGVRVFDPAPLEMGCRCSSERVQIMLQSFPRTEIETLKVGDDVVVTCEFCGHDYVYSNDDIDWLYDG